MKNKAIFKWNSGNLSLNCSKCNKIIKEGKDFTEGEMLVCMGKTYSPPQYCEQCKLSIKDESRNKNNR